MIKSIESSGKYVVVYQSTTGSNYVNNSNYMGVGDLRFNTNTQQLELYNGQNWQPFNINVPRIGLSPQAEDAISWALDKMEQEREARAMAKQHPAVADALGAVREAEQQLKMVVALCRV